MSTAWKYAVAAALGAFALILTPTAAPVLASAAAVRASAAAPGSSGVSSARATCRGPAPLDTGDVVTVQRGGSPVATIDVGSTGGAASGLRIVCDPRAVTISDAASAPGLQVTVKHHSSAGTDDGLSDMGVIAIGLAAVVLVLLVGGSLLALLGRRHGHARRIA